MIWNCSSLFEKAVPYDQYHHPIWEPQRKYICTTISLTYSSSFFFLFYSKVFAVRKHDHDAKPKSITQSQKWKDDCSVHVFVNYCLTLTNDLHQTLIKSIIKSLCVIILIILVSYQLFTDISLFSNNNLLNKISLSSGIKSFNLDNQKIT